MCVFDTQKKKVSTYGGTDARQYRLYMAALKTASLPAKPMYLRTVGM